MTDDFEMDDEPVAAYDPTPNFDAQLFQVPDKTITISKTLIGYPDIQPFENTYPVELTQKVIAKLFTNPAQMPKRIFAGLVGTNEHNTKFVVHTPFGYIGWLERKDFTYSNYVQGNTTIH